METSGELLYKDKIPVSDPKSYLTTKLGKRSEIFIKFLDTPTKTEKKDIFSKTSISKVIEKEYKSDTIYAQTILPKFLTVKEFKTLIAAILEIHTDAVDLNYEPLIRNPLAFEIYESNAVIGNYKFSIIIKPTSKPRFNGYDTTLIPILSKYNAFIASSKLKKQTLYPMITSLSYVLYNPKVFSIDIVRLFNLNKTSNKFPKICVHSDSLNSFLNEPNGLVASVKCLEPSLRPLQGIESSKNECTFIFNERIDAEGVISVSNFSVLANGLIILYFKNMRQKTRANELKELIETWISKNSTSLLTEIHLDECIYDLKFSMKDFKFTSLSHTMHVPIETKNKIHDLNSLNLIPAFKSVYSMKSSFRENGVQTHSVSTQQLINRVSNISTQYAATTMSFYFSTIIQINVLDDIPGRKVKGLMIELRNSTSIENSSLILTAILGRLDGEPMNVSKELLQSLREIDGRVRIKQLKNTDPIAFGNRITEAGDEKDYSQIVQSNDQRPSIITESEYKILKKEIPDSCLDVENQLTHERMRLVCPFEEYPIINYHAILKQPCIIKCTKNFSNKVQYELCDKMFNGNNEKNVETKFSSNTILKFTPNAEVGRRCYPPPEILNIFPNCHFLRCTDEMPIGTYCMNKYRLEVFVIQRFDDHYIIETEYVTGKTYAIALVTQQNSSFILCDSESGRPFEMNDKNENVFIQQLIKVSRRRNMNEKFVDFINRMFTARSEKSGNSEKNGENEKNEKLKELKELEKREKSGKREKRETSENSINSEKSENSKSVKSVKSQSSKSSQKFQPFPKDAKIKDVLTYLRQNYNTEFFLSIKDARVLIGMSLDGILYLIPPLFNLGLRAETVDAYLQDHGSSEGKQVFPSLEDLKIDEISKFYINFETGIVHAVDYCDNLILIHPTKITNIAKDVEYIDAVPFMIEMLGGIAEPISKPLVKVQLIDANFVLLSYINLLIEREMELKMENLELVMKDNLGDKNEIVYINHSPSWRKSKIDRKMLRGVKFNETENLRLMYEYTKENYNLVYDAVEEYLYRKQIY